MEQQVAGRWYPTVNKPNQWEAVCGKCGATVPAIALELKMLPFGKGERWQCKGGCASE